jgi:hypothetical protein
LALSTLVVGIGAVAAQAAQIAGSAGTVNLIGNDANPSGSFNVKVDYSVYDGNDPGDPLGVTADFQLVFQLTHQGSGGENPVLSVGRFTVFAPAGAVPAPYYTGIASVAQGGTVAPTLMDIDPPPAGPNRGEFFWEDAFTSPQLDAGEITDLLVLRTPYGRLPADVIIEVNHTEPQVHADTTIRLIPEPSAAALLLVGAAAVVRRRRSA